jgi:transcriptional regulator with XRE-family HTH domain
MKTVSTGIRFDGALMALDVARKGWKPIDLARQAEVADMTVYRFLSGERQTAPIAKKLATALGRSINRYLITGEREEASA